MRTRRNFDGWSRTTAAVSLAGAALFAASAGATEVKFPKANPKLQLNVPDGWSVAYTDIGLELRSPEKNSVVMAKLLKRDMTAVDAWKAKVFERMTADGISAAKTAQAETAQGKTPDPTTAAPKPAPEEDMPGTASTPTFQVAGAPSLAMPNFAKSKTIESVPGGASSPGGHKPKPAATINGLHFQSFRLEGAMFKDKPTDMQIVLFAMPKNEFFAVEQQSTPEDNRAAGILNSVKQLHH